MQINNLNSLRNFIYGTKNANNKANANQNIKTQPKEKAPATAVSMTDAEKELLNNFRKLDKAGQVKISAFVKGLLPDVK